MKKTSILTIMTVMMVSMNIDQTQASQTSFLDTIGDRLESVTRIIQNNLPDDDTIVDGLERVGQRIQNAADDVLNGNFGDEVGVRFHRMRRPQPLNPFSRVFQSVTDSVQDVHRGWSHQLNRRFR